jgi:PAS domain S-box-containing protein
MFAPHISTQWKSFAIRFVFPTAVTIALFVIAFFSIIIPAIEKSSMDRKREMIRELTNSAWNILAKLEYDEQKGLLTRPQAQSQAIEQIKNLHYGQEMKDYFWINDMHPRMVIHPYRTDLNGKDLSDYTDPEGKRVFVDFVDLVKRQGAGYMQYMWQWKDKEDRILPKLSYVKGFQPWGWIIGTGIYIDDVQAEIRELTRNLFEVSLFILLIIALLLASIIRQSYTTLKQQQLAEQALRDSEEKYRTLVESAGEGMLMALEGTYMHANQTIAAMLEYDKSEFEGMPVRTLLAESNDQQSSRLLDELLAGKSVPATFEARLKTKSGGTRDVILSASPIEVGGKTGFMAVVTDITNRKQAEDALGRSEEKFRTLANNLNVGIFRRTIGPNPKFIEANPALVKLLGCSSKEELLITPIISLYCSPEDRKTLEPKVSEEELKRKIVKLKKKDGSIFTASIWGVMVEDEDGSPRYCDGIMEDITDLHMREEEREKLLSEMQSSLLFYNQPLGDLPCRQPTLCLPGMPVGEAVRMMEQQNNEVLLVRDNQRKDCGVITDHDLRKAVMLPHRHEDRPVAEIMSSPVISLPGTASVFEAWWLMQNRGISHLFVTDTHGAIVGLISSRDIAAIHKYSPAVLLREIRNDTSPDEVIRHNEVLPYLITTLIKSGAKPENINHLTTIVIDTILQKLIEFAIRELGTPPVRFAFLVFGSEGRQEQTLMTDQDNAIIFEDTASDLEASVVQAYFIKLGTMVCRWLNQAGYHYCDGNNMAQNPQWCQPLTVWKRYFSEWIHAASAEDLLKTKIFFDFRCAYGEDGLAAQLRDFLTAMVADNQRFFQLLARNVLPLSPPIGLFGKFVVESVDEHRKAFDIKSAMMPIVDYARIYALKHAVQATNTLERLQGLHERTVLSAQNYQEMVQAYGYLMQIRLQVQAAAISAGSSKPDNYVTPKNLTSIEQKLLKEIFSQIKNFQAKLSYDFTGQIGGVQ